MRKNNEKISLELGNRFPLRKIFAKLLTILILLQAIVPPSYAASGIGSSFLLAKQLLANSNSNNGNGSSSVSNHPPTPNTFNDKNLINQNKIDSNQSINQNTKLSSRQSIQVKSKQNNKLSVDPNILQNNPSNIQSNNQLNIQPNQQQGTVFNNLVNPNINNQVNGISSYVSKNNKYNGINTINSITSVNNKNNNNLFSTNNNLTSKLLAAHPLVQEVGDVAIIRHAPGLNSGRVEGNIRVNTGEFIGINSGMLIAGNLYVPGTPNIQINGQPTYNGTLIGSGSASPSGYQINVNSPSQLKHIVTRTNASTIPNISNPPSPSGNRDVSLNAGQDPGDFNTLRNLTLNSNYGNLVVPAGTYGTFQINQGSSLTLGIAGQNTTYNLQSLTINGNGQIQILGIVTLNILNTVNINGPAIVGDVNNPIGLSINIAQGGVNLNSNGSFIYGTVQAPSGTVNLNQGTTLRGLVISDRLQVNGGKLQGFSLDTTGPFINISSPVNNSTTNQASVNVVGTYSDASAVVITVNGITASISGDTFTANNIALQMGSNTITILANDVLGNSSQQTLTIIRQDNTNQPPQVNTGSDQNITLPNDATINANVTDDGLPTNNLTYSWSKVSGEGTVSFSSDNQANTVVTFDSEGTYVLKLTVSDGALQSTDEITITVSPANPQNQAPQVNIGSDQNITLPNNAIINANVTDDGLPTNNLTYSWSKVSGEGTVSFSSDNQANTVVTFDSVGTYVLRLTVSDGALSASDEITIIVTNNSPLPTSNEVLIVRHAPGLNNGRIEGTIRQLLPENTNVNSGMVVTGDLLVIGTPNIQLNGQPITYNGTQDSNGNSSPNNYQITINSNTTLRHITRKTDAITLDNVPNPPTPTGTRDVSLNPGDNPGDFNTLRNLNLNSNYGNLAIPPGTYGTFQSGNNTGFIFGNVGENTVYNLQSLTLNTSSQLEILGNVTINLANQININGLASIGNSNDPSALSVNIAQGGLNLNSAGTVFYGILKAPNGTVIINAGTTLRGQVIADQFFINGGTLQGVELDNDAPTISITSPTNNQTINSETVVVTGTYSDESAVVITVNGVVATINGDIFTANIPLNLGSNTITAIITDANNNSNQTTITVNRGNGSGNQAPQVNAGNDQSINLPSTASLIGTVTDDGLPSPPAQVTVTWSKVSGPGTVTFSDPNNLTTTASFSEVGTYVLRLTATDSELIASDEVQITVNAQPVENQAPQVNAGADQNITLPSSATLNGTVTDDGLPNPPSELTISWSKVSGPGTVTFSSQNTATTQASFSLAGTYVLRLSASDSQLVGSDEVTVTVNEQPVQNQAPQVNAGQDQSITLPSTANLVGVVTDDGLPSPPSQTTVTWSKVSGPGTVTFSNPNSLTTTASFSESGTYVIRLSATDSELSANDDLVVVVNPQPPQNQAPQVNAGVDQEITLPSTASLVGVVTDDGLPSPPSQTTVTWSKVSGPGTVSFSNPNSLTTTVSFSESGTYVIRLSATDSELSANDELTVLVNPQPPQNQAPQVNAGTNQTINLSENLIKNASNESELVNGEIVNWTEITGSGWTQAIAGSNGLPSALQGNTYFVVGDSANAELSQDIDVSAFASQIANATQLFEFRGYVRSKEESPSDTARIVVEYRNATDLLASFDSGAISSANSWQLVRDLRNAPVGTTIIRIRLIASLNSGTSNDAYFDYLSLRTANLASTQLTGTASDDGLPVGSSLTTNWTKVSGPGNVVFSDENSVSSNVSFDQVGEYVLRLTASDSILTSSSDVTITVINNNIGAIVNAGDDQTITLPSTASLSGSYLEDGLPVGANITTTWSKIDGTGNVSFADANSLTTTATFSEAGIYTLRLTINDSVFTTTDDLIITVEPEPIQNTPPQVNAGNDQSINLPNVANLVGTVTDDGLPSPPSQTTITWSKVSGPGTVTFTDPNNLTTTASFSEVGTYVLRLTADDSELIASDEIQIVVNLGENQAPVVNAGNDQTIVVAYGPNLIRNSSGEADVASGTPAQWILSGFANWIKVVAATPPHPEAVEGTSYFVSTSQTSLRQDIDVSAYEASILNNTQRFIFNVYLRQSTTNAGASVIISYLSSTGSTLAQNTFSANSSTQWGLFTDNRIAPTTTKTIRIQLTSSGGYIDALSLRALLNTQDLATANLSATVTDDGLPSPPSQTTIAWSKVSGPGQVVFANPNQLNTTVSFNDLGTYVLRLTANDSVLSSFDEVRVVVSNVNNTNDIAVNAGEDQTLVVAYGPNLIRNPGNEGEIIEGRPEFWLNGGQTWIKPQAGTSPYPESVEGNSFFTVSSTSSVQQDIDVSIYEQRIATGTQVFVFNGYVRAKNVNVQDASIDVQYLSSTGVVLASYTTFSVNTNPINPNSWTLFSDVRTAPVGTKTIRVRLNSSGGYIDALSLRGLLNTSTLSSVNLSGSVLENTNPVDDRLYVQWSKVSGPGSVIFSNQNKVSTTATFTDIGTYTLRLTASDLDFSRSDDVIITLKNIDNTNNVTVNAGEDQTLVVAYGPNLIRNPGNEAGVINGTPAQWTGNTNWVQVVAGTPPYPNAAEGNSFFFSPNGSIEQNIDVSVYAQSIASGNQKFIFTSYVRKSEINHGTDVSVTYLSATGTTLANYTTGIVSPKDWTVFTDLRTAPVGTKTIRVKITSFGAYVDGLSLRALLSTQSLASTSLVGSVLENINPVDDRLYIQWSKVSGPGAVSFSTPNKVNTSVTFTDIGTYVLRLTASDLGFSRSDDVVITLKNIDNTNNVTVNAGEDQTLVVAYGPNLIRNPGNEGEIIEGKPEFWPSIFNGGPTWIKPVAGTSPYPEAVEGNSFFTTSTNSTSGMYQDIDISLYEQRIATGTQVFVFNGYLRSGVNDTRVFVEIRYLSSTGVILASYNTGFVNPSNWTLFSDVRTAPVGTKTIRVMVNSGGGYADALSLRALLNTSVLATANLAGTVLENGSPVNDRLYLQWSKVSGPGAVNFSIPNSINTSVTFTELGTYTLRLTASDLGFSLSDDVVITLKNIDNTNNVTVNAGEDQTLSIPYSSNLIKNPGNEGQLINNIPQDWTGSGTWTQPTSPPNPTPIEGNTYFFAPGNTIVQTIDLSAYEQSISAGNQSFIFSSFIRRNAANGNARILVEYLSAQGIVLGSYDTTFISPRDWTAFTHTQLAFFGTKSARVTLTCNNAYVDSLSLRALLGTTTFSSTQLTGSVLEGTNPVDDRLYLQWSKVSGPGNVIFSTPNHLNTNVTFTDAGTYVLRLTASDLSFSLSDDIVVTLNLGQTQNIAPRVVAGLEYQSITLPANTVTLKGIVTDDGLPTPVNIITTWSQVSGPGSVIFSNPNSLTTTATFSVAGVYLLRLSASDSQLTTTNDVTVEVFPLVSTTLSDLVVKQVDTSLVTVNSQTLEALGTVSANIANNAASTSSTFSVTFFEDLNSNQILDVTDNILGTTSHTGLQSGDSAIVSASVSGTVQFQNTLIYAFVDSSQEVTEFDETNNYGNSQPACEFIPLESPFNGAIKYAWTTSSVHPTYNSVTMTPVVADVNGDSIPDIIFSASQGFGGEAVLRAISGKDGSELFAVSNLDYALNGFGNLAVGDIDGDGLPEIVGVYKLGRNRLIAFEHDGTFKWFSAIPNDSSLIDGAPSIADLDNDGLGEIICSRNVFNSDGSLRWTGAGAASISSMVVDLDLDGTPEIVSNHSAFRANGQVFWQRPELVGDFAAIGNFDADVFPEIVLVSRGLRRVFLLEHDGTTKWACATPPAIDLGGHPTIGDFDGDGEAEIGIAGMLYYVVIETNGTIKWASYAPNITAGFTPSSSFDFDGDGSAEIVYADEKNLRIYRGTDGTVLWQTPTNSQTATDMAVVADVDADGSADIVLGSNPHGALGPLNGIRVYHNPTGKWVGTRKIWNQLAYHVGNVNDDATIPRQEERSWTKYNVYRSQQQVNGCIYARVDLTASYVRAAAENTNVLVTVRIGNGAGLKAEAGVAISFYDGNPSAGGTKLQTVNTLAEILPGKYEDVVATFTSTTIANPLWIVVDDGNNVLESNETNNIYNSGIILGIGNQAPQVNAGDDQTITLPSTASLVATVIDDGFPSPPGQITVTWSKVDGPGNVSFSNPNSLTTTATFDISGSYTLRITVNDSQLQSTDDVVITVNPAAENQAPQVNAGTNQSISLQANLIQNGGNESELVNGEIPSWTEVSGNWTQAVAGSNGLPNAYEGNTYFISSDSANAELVQTIDVSNFASTIAGQTQEFALRALVRSGDENPVDTARIVIEYLNSTNTVIAGLNIDVTPTSSNWTEVTDQSLAPVGTTSIRIKLIGIRSSGTTTDVYFDAVSFRPVGNTATLLSGTATDDGLPVGSSLTVNWTKVSGPGNVVFLTPNQAITGAIFDEVGTYVLRLSASDSVLSSESDITITVNNNNLAPIVNAGVDQTITLPSNASLSGNVSDDGLPLGANVTTTWSKVSGSGTVTFSNPNELNTTATFSESGTYVLALSASDTELNSTDEITIVVNPAPVQNQAPVVNAGQDQTITLPNTASLSATATDDGLPSPPAQLTFTWSKISGPGTVNFGTPNSLTTTASFSEGGSYVLRITASDSALSANDDVIVNVNAEGQQNQAPVVNAGQDQTLAITELATLTATATDDGLPPGSSLFFLWEKVSGPGTVGFNAPNSLQTQAQFSAEGVYILRFSASDSQFTTTDEVQITVVTPNVPAPEVTIHTPTDGTTITNLTDVIATITYTGASINWVLDYSLNPNDDLDLTRTYTTIATGNTTVTNSSIATFDPTVMLNGNYLLRLTATDNFGRSVNTVVTVIVDKNLKVGNFTLSFTDLAVPVAGIPISVIRTYDSRDKRKGDFGVGWTLDVKNIRLEKSSSLGKHWIETLDQEGFTFRYRLVSTRAKYVTITFPDGKVFKFKAVPNPSDQIAAIVNLNGMNYVPEPGTFGTLVALEPQELRVEGDVPQVPPGAGVVQIINLQGSTPGQPFNPRLFKLTTLEGAEFIIDEFNGLQSITDLNGNSLTVNNNGLVHSSGKSITFTRDAQGRITQVTDPSGNVQIYTYDTAGDLVSHRDMENNVTSFSYNNNHYLLDITDPRGIKPIRNEYDDDGRLLKHKDAFNKEIIYTHQIAARTEVIADRLGNVTTFEYDNSGNVLKQTNALGHITTYTYDANDNQLTETNALGKTTTSTYDQFDNLLTQTDPLNNTVTYTYNTRRQVLTITDPKGNVSTNTYDNKGNLTTTKDALNNTTSYTYNPFGLVLTQTDALGHVTTYQYSGSQPSQITDAQGNVSSFTYDINGNQLTQTVTRTVNGSPETITTTNTYDKLNRLTKVTYPDGSETTTTYNAIGKVASSTDQLGRSTSYSYDSMGQLLSTTFADGTSTSSTYDAEGRRLTSTDQLGRVTSFQYDVLGRLTKTTAPDNSFTTTVYDSISRVTSTTDQLGHTTNYEYDANCGCSGRRSKIIDALGNQTSFAYDQNGNQISFTDARGNTTTTTYDQLNRQTRVTFQDGTFQETIYDQLGRRTAVTDQAGKTTQFFYDSLGRLIKVKDALNHETQYGYDELGQQITQIDAKGRTTRYEYDKLGRRTKRTLPMGQFETYSYDLAGRLTSHRDFDSKVTSFAYDQLNRLLSETPDASFNQAPITFTYNNLGQIVTATGVDGTISLTYDNRNRLTQAVTPQGTLSYSYNLVGNILSVTSSNTQGVTLEFGYDLLNRLQQVKDNNQPTEQQLTSYSYDQVGNLSSVNLPNGVSTSYQYNNLNRLTNVATAKLGTPIASYAYSLGAAGNRLSVSELSGRVVNYTYDSIYRLTSETITGNTNPVLNGSVSYAYDEVGNRLSRTSTLAAVPSQQNIETDANDRLTTDTYDDNGSTISADGYSYGYDYKHRIISVIGNEKTISIKYNAFGNRVEKSVTQNGQTVVTQYLVDTNNHTGYAQVVEEIQDGVVSRQYSYGLDLISQRQLIGNDRITHYFHYDGHGSVRYLTDVTGVITDTYDYDAAGILINRTGTTPNNYLYAGEQYDHDLNLYYNRARYLDVNRGRFWSQDSFEGGKGDPLSLHKYLYGNGNPVNNIDPSGNNTVEFAVFATVATVLASIAIIAFRQAFGSDSTIRVKDQPVVITTFNSLFDSPYRYNKDNVNYVLKEGAKYWLKVANIQVDFGNIIEVDESYFKEKRPNTSGTPYSAYEIIEGNADNVLSSSERYKQLNDLLLFFGVGGKHKTVFTTLARAGAKGEGGGLTYHGVTPTLTFMPSNSGVGINAIGTLAHEWGHSFHLDDNQDPILNIMKTNTERAFVSGILLPPPLATDRQKARQYAQTNFR